MEDNYLKPLEGYETNFEELKNINHIDLINITEGITPVSDAVRHEARTIFNKVYGGECEGYGDNYEEDILTGIKRQ